MTAEEKWHLFINSFTDLTPDRRNKLKRIYYAAFLDGINMTLQLIDGHINANSKEKVAIKLIPEIEAIETVLMNKNEKRH